MPVIKLKEQQRNLILTHLKTKGYPKMTAQQIFDELPALYEQLVAAKLFSKPYTTFVQLVKMAYDTEYMKAQLRGFGFKV